MTSEIPVPREAAPGAVEGERARYVELVKGAVGGSSEITLTYVQVLVLLRGLS